ncbi:MAG: diguanylate cyclase [Sphingomonadales bacterium]|nr:diguanylate cyclase [Sphingomonadales bacterium]
MRQGRSLAMSLLVLLAALLSWPAQAAPTSNVSVCLLRIPAGANIALLGDNPAGLDCRSHQTELGSGNFLAVLKFAPIRASADDPLVLRTTSSWQDGTRIRFHYADGSTAEIAYSSRSAAPWLTIGAIFEYAVPWKPVALDHITIVAQKAANLRGVVNGAELLTRNQSTLLKMRMAGLYAGFAGLALALVVYNLALWAAMRYRFQLLYCAMVAMLGAYTFTSSGTAMALFPALANNDRLRLNYVLLALSGAAALQFIRHFFEPEILGSRLRWSINIASVFAITAGVGFALCAPAGMRVLDTLYFVAMGGLLLHVPPILLAAWRGRSHYFWMFVVAWSAPVFTSVLRVLHGFDLLGYSFWLDNGNLIATSLEALLSSIMVTLRLRELTRDREDAIANEQLARRLAGTDPLTGLLNRRAFIDLAVGRKGRHRLMLVDIDHFKAINDRFGHDTGDEVLRTVAQIIQKCRPPGSLAVRLGGEEFAMLVPDRVAVECSPESLLRTVRDHPMPLDADITVSIGFADGAVTDEEGWKRLYRIADGALLRAKADGRDRACRATDFRVVA